MRWMIMEDEKIDVKKIGDNIWEIPKTGKMKVPAIIYASDILMEKIKEDLTLKQARNVACLNGILKSSFVMPDAHQGYGFSIGGVAAFDMDDGVISPGGVGYDINCGVRLLRTPWKAEQVLEKRHELLDGLFTEVPCGVGKGGLTKLSGEDLRKVLVGGAEWAVENGYGTEDDLDTTEENGRMSAADPAFVSDKAMKRGMPQLGTLGSGNHFLEIQKVDKIYDKETAEAFGITEEGQVTVMIHCGSRGLGHQIASDYIREMEDEYGIEGLPDRELINAPIRSELGQRYYKAMCCAVNFAFANRHMIMHWTRDVFRKAMGTSEGMDLVYDVCHNIAKFEKHIIEGVEKEVCVHRKGATRSFGPGRIEIPEKYRSVGQPVIIPGSMGTASYLLVGTGKSEEMSFGSTAHGAGRVASRHEALRKYSGEQIRRELREHDILVRASSMKGIAEEAPQVYKDIDEVVRVSHELRLAKMVVRLVPLAVMKG
jgi:tRNA-splicing ligase RtcB